MVEDLRLSRLGLGNERVVQDLKNILADALELSLDLLAVFRDDGDVLLRTLGVLLLLDGGDDAPRGTAGANDVLVSNGQKVALIDGKFAANLETDQYAIDAWEDTLQSGERGLKPNIR